MRNIGKKIVIFVFALSITVPLLLTNLKPNKVSKLENRTLAKMPELYNSEGNFNKDYIAELENWFNDNVGLREKLYEANSMIQYCLFGNSAVDDVVVGKDGWLFYNKQHNLEIATEHYLGLTENDLKILCDKQVSIKEKLNSKGIEYALVLPPSKTSIYPEYIKGDFGITETPVDIVADYIETHSDVKVIRLKETLLEEKQKNPDKLLYFKTDTHWNAYGVYVAYKEVLRKLQEWGISEDAPVNAEFGVTSGMRDLMMLLVKDNERFYETGYINYSLDAPKAHLVSEGENNNYIQNYIQTNSLRRGDYFENTDKSLPSFAIFGDSMFMDWMLPLLAENSSETTGIWSYEINGELIDSLQPDVVLLEVTERSLGSLLKANDQFIQTSIKLDGRNLHVEYRDLGKYENLWIPIWSEENGQDDLIWYRAERMDDWNWKMDIDLDNHKTNGVYNIHFYQGDTDDCIEADFVIGEKFDVGSLY